MRAPMLMFFVVMLVFVLGMIVGVTLVLAGPYRVYEMGGIVAVFFIGTFALFVFLKSEEKKDE